MQLPRDAAAGLRQGGIFGLAEEDIDFDEMVIHVRRQVKKLGKYFVFALPKSDMERTVPMSEGTALTLRAHIDATGPRPYTLPWERLDGPPMTVRILFRWTDDRHIRAWGYDESVWKPALTRPEGHRLAADSALLDCGPRNSDGTGS